MGLNPTILRQTLAFASAGFSTSRATLPPLPRERFRFYLALRAPASAGAFFVATNRWSAPMSKQNDLSRCLVALEQEATLIAVIEMGQAS